MIGEVVLLCHLSVEIRQVRFVVSLHAVAAVPTGMPVGASWQCVGQQLVSGLSWFIDYASYVTQCLGWLARPCVLAHILLSATGHPADLRL